MRNHCLCARKMKPLGGLESTNYLMLHDTFVCLKLVAEIRLSVLQCVYIHPRIQL